MPVTDQDDTIVRPGTYARGNETVDTILKAALTLLIDEGAAGFTMRRIANLCGLRVGNVSYHFPRKEMLVQVLLEELMESYDQKLDLRVRPAHFSPEERLRTVIVMCLDDIGTKRTTRLFTELWALANHDEFIADRVSGVYRKVHSVIGDCIAAMNPSLSESDVKTLSLFISACMEGTTPFLGYQKPWSAEMPAITAMQAAWLVDLVKTIKPGDIAALRDNLRSHNI